MLAEALGAASSRGLDAERLYSLTVNPFYLAANDTVQLAVAFAAFVSSTEVTIGEEHDAFEWLSVAAATKRFGSTSERVSSPPTVNWIQLCRPFSRLRAAWGRSISNSTYPHFCSNWRN